MQVMVVIATEMSTVLKHGIHTLKPFTVCILLYVIQENYINGIVNTTNY
jgi:hypothetical protein